MLRVEGGQPPAISVTPQAHRAAARLPERHGLRPGFETARMYLGQAPAEPIERIYGVTTFELG